HEPHQRDRAGPVHLARDRQAPRRRHRGPLVARRGQRVHAAPAPRRLTGAAPGPLLPLQSMSAELEVVASELGLRAEQVSGTLADLIWRQQTSGDAEAVVRRFVDPDRDVADEGAAVAGARDICAERVAESAPLRGLARRLAARDGLLRSDVVPARRGERTRYEDHYGRQERLAAAPSHRVLAVFRGEAEGVLRVRLALPDE